MSSLQSALSIKQWDREAFASDPWGRNLYGNGRLRLLTARSMQPLAARWFADTKIVVNALIMEIKNLSPLFSLSELSEPTERVRRLTSLRRCCGGWHRVSGPLDVAMKVPKTNEGICGLHALKCRLFFSTRLGENAFGR